MRLITALAAFVALTACAMPDAERRAAVDVALSQIEAYNAAGYDPVQLDERELMHLQMVCLTAPVFFPTRSLEIIDYCTVIQEAAQ